MFSVGLTVLFIETGRQNTKRLAWTVAVDGTRVGRAEGSHIGRRKNKVSLSLARTI